MKHCLLLLACLLTGVAAATGGAQPASTAMGCKGSVQVSSSQTASEVWVQVRLGTQADPATVWSVITDYANASRFIRHLRRSDATPTAANTVRVSQVGRARWGPFSADVATEYEVHLQPNIHQLHGHLLNGDVKDMHLEAALSANGDGTDLRYVNRITPASWMPLSLAEPLLAQSAQDSFEDLLAEIHRRASHCSTGKNHATP